LAMFAAWESLSVLSVIVLIQGKYDVILSASEMKGVKTAQDLYDLVTLKRTPSMPSDRQ
jgi:acyl carrier protein